ncbi:putative glucan endo-1,3-beta-D-glucosidase [Helianthus annuus]|uniref:glucan endo-1,3-beta-D-glucosidase n=1 Tax=Helianthus annuus TaxID=4232 RepID=A0A251VRH8_HELAN|nr:probable glucan endo-1,3-beta-glucosidase A6 [Helianthus annuus]KAF5822995.1 putative glucan endo-1,3-beta-D-glucosidase [Helianthus annuus]KAJ0623857.1 putative glucan endo-1,3-beta-D-glucosidase [Helianthus annuus]KAJ0949029.1 putative glucan endo-1,3-beta-D-glucosidase [Helianthus annuus]
MENKNFPKMALVFLSFLSLIAFSGATVSNMIGVNYGRLGNNLPSPARSIEILQDMNVSRVKLYDADHEILNLLSGKNIEVAITVTNDEISGIAANQRLADQWVYEHIIAHHPNTKIRFVLVGDEVFSSLSTDQDIQIARDLVPAIRRIKNTIKARGIRNIKVGTPLAMDMMEMTFPPSNASFKPELREFMTPLLKYINGTKSFFFLDVYPYLAWFENQTANQTNISLDFALLRSVNVTYTDPQTGLVYTNLLDQMLDSVVYAMSKLGYDNVMLAISETGWPHEGGSGANPNNAAEYNNNLVRKMTAVPSIGTPARPGQVIPTFIFSLYDEDQKYGPATERHWGMLTHDGSPVYAVNITRMG